MGEVFSLKIMFFATRKPNILQVMIHGDHHHPDKITDTIIMGYKVKQILRYALAFDVAAGTYLKRR